MTHVMEHGPADARGSGTWVTRAFTESLHARGTGVQGGQFVAKGAAKTAPAAAKRTPAGRGLSMAFDGKRGTGYGVKGGDKRVRALQEALNRLGLTDGAGKKLAVDGKLGPRTTVAIKKAQRKLGLRADGVVTPALLAKLTKAKKLEKAKPVKKATPAKKATAPRARPVRSGKGGNTPKRAPVMIDAGK